MHVKIFVAVAIAVSVSLGSVTHVIAQECLARVDEAREAIKAAEAAVAKAKDSGKAAAKAPLAKAKKELLHAEAECKTDGPRNLRKNAEAGRHAREVQGLAEEAKLLAEKL
jgi:hypothetical protein